ncbi:MAG TPA: murein L,D-transpeptidase, partial [Anaerolineae bacterium]|nr:murein L,D-transpeptidase [Anaerolineae bacterium]
ANNLRSTSLVYVGQRLIIPTGGAATAPKPAPAPVQAPTADKWIDINLTTQALVAYEGQRPVYWATVSTGRARTPTPTGRYRIYKKLRFRTMSGPGYHLPNVPYVMYFYKGYTLHGTYWHSNFGRPASRGCVNLRLADAQWLYEWAPVGTLVIIHR